MEARAGVTSGKREQSSVFPRTHLMQARAALFNRFVDCNGSTLFL